MDFGAALLKIIYTLSQMLVITEKELSTVLVSGFGILKILINSNRKNMAGWAVEDFLSVFMHSNQNRGLVL